MTDKDKIEILFKEYDTLREEIISRLSQRINFLGLFGAIGVYAFFQDKTLNGKQYIIIVLAAILLYCVWHHLGNVVARCSKRIAEIECVINKMAGTTLLVWEHEKRGSKLFHKVYK